MNQGSADVEAVEPVPATDGEGATKQSIKPIN